MRALTAGLIVALTIAACGGEAGETPPGTQTGTQTQTQTQTQTGTTADAGPAPVELEGSVNDHGTADLTGDSLDLEADDFYFAPTFVRTSTAGTVQVRVFNEGDQRHTFTIEEQDVDVVLEPGSEQQLDVLLPDSGALRFVCRFHVNQGMQGAFFHADAGGGTTPTSAGE